MHKLKNPKPNSLQYQNMQRIAQYREQHETGWETNPAKLDLTWYFTAILRLESYEELAPGGYAGRCLELITLLKQETDLMFYPRSPELVLTDDEIEKQTFEHHVKDTFEDELADAVIRILDLCGAKGIDIEKHIELKMKYNETRERMHGKKY